MQLNSPGRVCIKAQKQMIKAVQPQLSSLVKGEALFAIQSDNS